MERRRRLAIMLKILMLRQMEHRSHAYWVRPIWLNREFESEFYTAMRVMMKKHPELFFKFYRMTPDIFIELHDLVKEKLTKMHMCRKPIPSAARLAMTIRYLSSGDPIKDIALAFRVGLETAREAIHLTCAVLWDVLSPLYMKPPGPGDWEDVSRGFWQTWQFPNCVGAVDGKHVQIVCPRGSGSLYFNYKKTYSVVLMAVVDSQYQFRLVDVGAPGRLSDGGVFKDSPIGQRLASGQLGLPESTTLPGSETTSPYMFIGDEAFQMRPDFMRPLPGTRDEPDEIVFNYRLSRARRCSENAFGILAARWQIFNRTINLSPNNVVGAVKAACVLHNLLCTVERARTYYCPNGYADSEDSFGRLQRGRWRDEPPSATNILKLQATRARNSSLRAADVRRQLMLFFMNEGSVSWQWNLPGVRKPSC